MTRCEQPDCTGTIEDGYCDLCGLAPTAGAMPPPGAAPERCAQPGCTGAIEDGYCNVCGLAAEPVSTPVTAPSTTGTGALTVASGRATRRGSSRSRSTRTGRSNRGHLGAGLVTIAPVPYRNPSTAIMSDPQVPEHDRYCSRCGKPVGRGRDGRAGRTEGFCAHCGAGFSFAPKLTAGDLVAGQYEVLGCLAHGGLGWIYLARDRNVSDRWVVLKGLLDSGDSDAMAAAVAERRFLAAVKHPNIVEIYNFVQHPEPRTGELVGYIVMEYVGGASLKELRSNRSADGKLQPLPPAQGLAYLLEILPAFEYLHAQGLLYCDFKPDNVIQSEEQLRLIDLGAVRRMADEDSVGFKTDGYAAPELETLGASIESDLYTIGRTLAVLTFNFDYRKRYLHELPPAADVPVLQQHPSLHRLLLRATDADPEQRFGSATEMIEQFTGVLREVVAAEEGVPHPALSTVFGTERAGFGAEPIDWPRPLAPAAVARNLPVPLVNSSDPAAGWLATIGGDPGQMASTLAAAPTQTYEVRLARVRAFLEYGDIATAMTELDALEQGDDADWRIGWYRGTAALAADDTATARELFDATYELLPGEAAPKLALAAATECHGDPGAAARLYRLVWCTDHGYPSAAFGLARTLLAQRDFDGAIAAVESVPASSSHYLPARLAAVRIRIHAATEQHLVAAGHTLTELDLDPERKARFGIQILDAARALATGRSRAAGAITVLNCPLEDRPLRRALESEYRTLARLAADQRTRRDLVNRANAIRPLSWV
jgi:serine/threonine-protein kinase PknG